MRKEGLDLELLRFVEARQTGAEVADPYLPHASRRGACRILMPPCCPLPLDVPVDPDAPEARDWLLDELSKQPYQAAQPTFIDLLAQQILQWFGDLIDWLFGNGAGGAQTDVPALAARRS